MYEVYSRKVVGCVELEAFLDWKYNKSEAVNSREALYKSGWPEAWVVQGGLDAPPPLRDKAWVTETELCPGQPRAEKGLALTFIPLNQI